MDSLDIEEKNYKYNLLHEKEHMNCTTQSQKVSSKLNHCVILYHQNLIKNTLSRHICIGFLSTV